MSDDWTHEVYDQHVYKGVIFSGNFSKSNIERCADLHFSSDDVVIYSYMRSGTTLTQHIVWSLTDDDMDYNASLDDMFQRYIFMEDQPILEDPDAPPDLDKIIPEGKKKLYKTHLPTDMLPNALINGTSHPKLIIVARNPYDVAVSSYNFYRDLNYNNFYKGTWDSFFTHAFIGGKIIYGRWFDWIKNLAESNLIAEHNPLILRYEDLILDFKGQVKRIADFLNVQLDDAKLKNIMKLCDIERQKKTASDQMKEFVRKGKVGKWKEIFSDTQIVAMQSELKKLPSFPIDFSTDYSEK